MNEKIYVDKARLLRRVIIISWITLALCFVVKIFGGNFFEIMCDSPNYKRLCEYADTHLWLKFTLGFVSSMICQCLYELAIIQKYNFSKKELIVTVLSVVVICGIKLFNQDIGLICDLWLLIALPILLLGKDYKRYYNFLLGFLFNFAFQLLSVLVKNLSIGVIDNSTFISLIYMIDLYIMCFLYYLYRNYRKEQKEMGIFWTLFAGKPADKLKAMKAKREAKIKKLESEINTIEIELSKKKDK